MDYGALIAAIEQAHQTAQRHAVQAVNLGLTLRNWLIGYNIVEYEQHGRDRAQYGGRLLAELTRDLKRRLGRGFARRSLELSRQFYLRYPIAQSLIAQFGVSVPNPASVALTALDWQDNAYFARLFQELPWTHFIELIRMDDPLQRAFYEVETLKNRWSVRELKRQIDSLLYERVGLSRDKDGVLELAKEGELHSFTAKRLDSTAQGRGSAPWGEENRPLPSYREAVVQALVPLPCITLSGPFQAPFRVIGGGRSLTCGM